MILSDRDILRALEEGRIKIRPEPDLNTQLGSWAELRHDTLLYAKQSYTGIPACEYPDVYVEPYPELFAAIVKYAEQGARIVEIAAQPVDGIGHGPAIVIFEPGRSIAADRLQRDMHRAHVPFERKAGVADIGDLVDQRRRLHHPAVMVAGIDLVVEIDDDLVHPRDDMVD